MKTRKEKYGRTPIRSLEELRISQMKLDQRIRQYLVSWKPEISDQLRNALELRASRDMNAANLISRIQLADSLRSELHSHFSENEIQAAFSVTLISELHAVQLQEHGEYDLAAHCDWIASALEGYDYVGMIEPAYFPDAAFLRSREDWLSWHAHVIIWNIDKKTLKELKDAVNGIEVAFRPGGIAFEYRKAQPDDIEPEVAYLSKSPCSEYRAYRPRGLSVTDRQAQSDQMGNVAQNKREIRTGKLLMVLSALCNKSIDSLLVAGGAGIAIRNQTLKSARQALEKEYLKRKHMLNMT